MMKLAQKVIVEGTQQGTSMNNRVIQSLYAYGLVFLAIGSILLITLLKWGSSLGAILDFEILTMVVGVSVAISVAAFGPSYPRLLKLSMQSDAKPDLIASAEAIARGLGRIVKSAGIFVTLVNLVMSLANQLHEQLSLKTITALVAINLLGILYGFIFDVLIFLPLAESLRIRREECAVFSREIKTPSNYTAEYGSAHSQ